MLPEKVKDSGIIQVELGHCFSFIDSGVCRMAIRARQSRQYCVRGSEVIVHLRANRGQNPTVCSEAQKPTAGFSANSGAPSIRVRDGKKKRLKARATCPVDLLQN